MRRYKSQGWYELVCKDPYYAWKEVEENLKEIPSENELYDYFLQLEEEAQREFLDYHLPEWEGVEDLHTHHHITPDDEPYWKKCVDKIEELL